MKVAIVTDAWHPQVNGVVRTLQTTGECLRARGHEVQFITPTGFRTVPCPTYPSIRLAVMPGAGVASALASFAPAAIHIATEGPLGMAARAWCLRRGHPFTTSFHTQFAEYVRLRAPIPLSWTYAWLRRFHGAAVRTLVPTPGQRDRLLARGFRNIEVWARGVDTSVFRPQTDVSYPWPGPVALYMGRVAVEKNIEAFLELEMAGSKVVIGDGPALASLQKRYPGVHFLGAKFGTDLARHVAAADVMVFPSRTDTFGLVLLEAMACGVPVAAYPVTGPIDVVAHGRSGWMDDDLGAAVQGALGLSRQNCVDYAAGYSWQRCTETFESCLEPVADAAPLPARA
ncbi:MAG: glycosyltransferase family 1 protein [Gammaproteobacteria bacterium]|nr:glycosyltransferase family 1 protein [Gammaproteobacteria bacterium]